MAHWAQEIEELEKEKAAFTKTVDIIEKAIISRGKKLKEFVDQCTWSLLKDLTEIKYDGLKAIECENEDMQQRSKAPTKERIPSIQIAFEISRLEDFLKGNNIIGKIKSLYL